MGNTAAERYAAALAEQGFGSLAFISQGEFSRRSLIQSFGILPGHAAPILRAIQALPPPPPLPVHEIEGSGNISDDDTSDSEASETSVNVDTNEPLSNFSRNGDDDDENGDAANSADTSDGNGAGLSKEGDKRREGGEKEEDTGSMGGNDHRTMSSPMSLSSTEGRNFNAEQCSALLMIYNELGGPQWPEQSGCK